MESQMHVFHVALCYHNEVVLDAVFLCQNYSITSLTGVYSWVFSLVFQPSKLLLLRIMSIVDIFKATRSPQALNKYLFISVPHIFGPLTTIQVIAFASLRTENCCLFHLFHVLFSFSCMFLMGWGHSSDYSPSPSSFLSLLLHHLFPASPLPSCDPYLPLLIYFMLINSFVGRFFLNITV